MSTPPSNWPVAGALQLNGSENAVTMVAQWQASIERPDAADWITVAAYLLAAFLSTQAAGQANVRRQTRDGKFWRLTAVLLVMLAINELLDLQTLLTSLGRSHAKAYGWYGERRRVQYVIVVALGNGAVFASIVMLWLTKRMHTAVRMALVGLAFIGLFVLVRAASFHHMDNFLGRGAREFNWGSLQEMAGIFTIAVAAIVYILKPATRC